MGVPGLWRILDLASQPLDFEKCSGLRIAIDINSHANRLVHSQSASNWIYILARDIFRILHFNIRVVVVFMGRRPLEKIYSSALGDVSEDTSYYRVRSLILRSNKQSPNREQKSEPKPEKNETLSIPIPTTKVRPRKRVLAHLEDAENINDISKRQIDSISQTKPLPSVQLIHHSNFSSHYIFFEQNDQFKNDESKGETNSPKKEIQFQVPQDPNSNTFYSSLLDDVKDIISESDPSSEGSIPPEEQEQTTQVDTLPISLLPDDNSYLPPIENYITATHINLIMKLCDILGIPYIQAEEEASAECARLEKEGIVDAVASDDNNCVLFGAKWMIRGIFVKPQSITIETLEKAGLTKERMIMIAMMIDGDYNMDIRKRLFTVGPVRGMEILSFFPDEKVGLFNFKDWWIKVVKNKKVETNPDLKKLSKMKWLKKLIMPSKFPPIELLNAFVNPKVGDEKPVVGPPKFDKEELITFLKQRSSISEERIKEHVNNFAKRIESFAKDGNKSLFIYSVNELKENSSFQDFFDRIIEYDKKRSIHNSEEVEQKETENNNNNNDDDDEWDTVSDTGSESNNNENNSNEEEEENDEDSIEEDKDSIEEGDSIEED